jgi:hypothetical protein
MKRNNLTTAVVAGIAGVAGFAGLANAVDLNPDGLGQVLVYPYYTVNKHQDTLVSVVNTTAVGKAVKVRFLEGYNSREVLDFNLFLSPHDVWTAAITAVGDDTTGAKIITHDHSCTYPAIPAAGQAFSSAAYTGASIAPFNVKDAGPQSITRTREGYLELISMGDIIPASPLDDATIHHQTGTPNAGTPDCTASALLGGAADVVAPTGGLFGAGSIVNVGDGTFFPYNADAIDGFTAIPLFNGSSALEPSLQRANSTTAVAPGTARAFVFVNGALVTADYVKGIDAVSAVFMSESLYNEYLVGAGLGANTDWIVTFPTKRFYVDGLVYAPTPRAPFVEKFAAPGESNVAVGINLYDQEEFHTTTSEGFSPPVGTRPSSLPYEVNVISFLNGATSGGVSGVFGSILRPNITPLGSAGWLQLGFNDAVEPHALPGGVSPTAGAVTFQGLPATGYMGYNIINANANPGLLANYSGMFRHRANRSCTVDATQAACS